MLPSDLVGYMRYRPPWVSDGVHWCPGKRRGQLPNTNTQEDYWACELLIPYLLFLGRVMSQMSAQVHELVLVALSGTIASARLAEQSQTRGSYENLYLFYELSAALFASQYEQFRVL